MTVVVYALLCGGWLAIAAIAALYLPVIALFGRDDPGTTMTHYLVALSVPPVAVVCMSTACWLAHRLWQSRRWKPAGFALACGLAVLGVWLTLHLRPH